MAFKNFKLETDADGIALVTWDIPGRSMNVLDETSISELEAIVKQTTADAAVKGVVITSSKEAFCAGADLSMLEGMSQHLCQGAEGEGRGRRQPDAVRPEPPLLAGVPRHRNLGQAVGRRDQRPRARRRFRADAGLPLSRRRRQSEDAARPARDQGRPVPRRRRHPARAAHRAAAGCDAAPAQGRGDQARQGQGAEPDPRHRAGGRPDQGRQGLDQGRRQGRRALGREGFQAAGRTGVLQGRHDDVPGRQRHLSPRDLRQLSGGARHHELRL